MLFRSSREYTLDDFYYIHLDKLDRYVCLKESGVIIPADGNDESSGDEEDEDDDDDDEDEGDENDGADESVGAVETAGEVSELAAPEEDAVQVPEAPEQTQAEKVGQNYTPPYSAL